MHEVVPGPAGHYEGKARTEVCPVRLVFLALAAWGAIHPMVWFLAWFRTNGGGLGGMIDAWYVNEATTGLTWDLTIAAITLTAWVVAETVSRRDWLGLAAIPATFGIGLSCGLPLYLWLRSRPR
jgi:hypothetical protein